MDIQDWSTTASNNTDVDGINIAEGMSPANVNNAMRAIMANLAAFRDLIGGAKVSAGTADAQTLTTGLSLSAYQQGILIGFEAGAGLTNTGAMTIAVDGLAAKSVKVAGGSDPAAGAVTAGSIYILAYEATADVLFLLNPKAGLANVVEDTTPQLGGNLDLNSRDITGTGNINITGAGTFSSTVTVSSTIELGHASDTTLTRVSAGVVSVEGSNILLASGLGSITQAYDADTTKNDVANTFTQQQTIPTINLTGGQIAFPATQAASGDANTLDDYEEGTWTPTYSTDGVDFTSVTYSTQTGFYTKIGNRWFINVRVKTNSITVGSASGNVVVKGIPATPSNGVDGGAVFQAVNTWAGDVPISWSTQVATASLELHYRTAANAVTQNLAVADLTTGAGNDCYLSGHYR